MAEFLRDELGRRQPLGGLDHDAVRPTVLYTGLMTRAVETGRVIARALGVPLVALTDAHELAGLYLDDEVSGEKRGMPGPNRAHFQTQYPELELPEQIGEEGWWNRPHEPKESASGTGRACLERARARGMVKAMV